jgi:hypothetical protein
MVDEETVSGGGSTASICPWCSATYTGERETCPSCGAALATDPTADSSLPGLTAIDAEAIVRAKTPVARPRNRLLSWISGEYPDQGGAVAEAGALAPPDLAVRREILRLELEAQVANLQAEADALMSEATVDGRLPRVAPVVDELEAVQAGLHQIDEALGETEAEAATEPSPESLEMAADEAAAEAADEDAAAPDDGTRPA